MNVRRSARNCAMALAAGTLIGTAVPSPAAAAELPYTCQITVSLEFSNGAKRVTIIVNCANPGEYIKIDVIANLSAASATGARARQIGMLQADQDGIARGTLALPQDLPCDATIRATGQESKRTAYTNISFEPCEKDAVTAAAAPNRADLSSGKATIGLVDSLEQLDARTDSDNDTQRTALLTLAGSSRDVAAGSGDANPMSSTAAAGLGLLVAVGAAGALTVRRRGARNHY